MNTDKPRQTYVLNDEDVILRIGDDSRLILGDLHDGEAMELDNCVRY